MTEQEYLDVAAAILDGTPVSWDTLPEPVTDGDRGCLQQLRLLADLRRVHRDAHSPVGTTWGHLLIVEPLGVGTFGDVYKARDTVLDRDVALKLLRSATAGRHVSEGRALARVRHPNVVTVFGAAEHDGRCGIWMELVQGETLAQLVAREGPLDAGLVTAIGLDICRALGAVHASGLLHGDVKAQNVMREADRIALMDFGTGRVADDATAAMMAGTPLYIAPEVLNGDPISASSDIYGVGVLLYFLLTGTFPVTGRTLADIRAAHASGLRTLVRARRQDVPQRLAAVIDRATAPAVAARIQSAAELEAALIAASPAAVGAGTRSRWWMAAVSAMVACAIGGGTLAVRAVGGRWPFGPRGIAATQNADLNTRRVFPATEVAGSFGPPSADGRYIAFSQYNGALGLLDLSTGSSRILSSVKTGTQTAGSISPDSRQIAYAAGSQELRIADIETQGSRSVYADSSLSRLVAFEWARDASAVLVLMTDKGGVSQLAMISAADGAVRVLKRGVRAVWKASLSPDARFVAYDELQESGTQRTISIVSTETGSVVPLAVGSASSPAWTPDGRAIVYQSDRTGTIGSWMVPISEGRAASDPVVISRAMGRITPLGVTNDGAYYYLLQSAMIDVYVAPIDRVTGQAQAPASMASTSVMGANWFPDWSPDGKYLAYSSARNERLMPARVLTIRTVDDGHVRELPTDIRFFDAVRWSPGGRSLLLRGSDRTGKPGLFEVDAGTGAILRTIRTPQSTNEVEWSSDGRQLLYTMARGDFFVHELSGRDRSIPYSESVQKFGMAKSSDDRWLAFSRLAEGVVTMVVMPAGGGAGRDLLSVSRPDFVLPAAWTADGRYLLFTRWRSSPTGGDEGNRRTLWRIPASGGEPEYLGLSMHTMRQVRLSPDGTRVAFTSGFAGSDLWVMENFLPAAGRSP